MNGHRKYLKYVRVGASLKKWKTTVKKFEVSATQHFMESDRTKKEKAKIKIKMKVNSILIKV